MQYILKFSSGTSARISQYFLAQNGVNNHSIVQEEKMYLLCVYLEQWQVCLLIDLGIHLKENNLSRL